MDIQLWKNIALIIAIGTRVFDILDRVGVYKAVTYDGDIVYRNKWVAWLDLGMLVAGLAVFVSLSILERFQ